MDDLHEHAREQFFDALRAMAISTFDIQSRLVDAYVSIRDVKLDEFNDDAELKLKLARILDLLAVDTSNVDEEVVETTHRMTDIEAAKVAHLICDFYYELG
jgi:neutral trehalase